MYQTELVFALLLVDCAELPACSHAPESRVGLDGQVVCRYVLYAQTEQALDVGFEPFVGKTVDAEYEVGCDVAVSGLLNGPDGLFGL